MKRKDVIWIFGSTAVVTAATLGVAACSGDSTTTIPGVDSGKVPAVTTGPSRMSTRRPRCSRSSTATKC